jgi:hypothetical protein
MWDKVCRVGLSLKEIRRKDEDSGGGVVEIQANIKGGIFEFVWG